MRSGFRVALAFFLSAFLISMPLFGAQSRSLGFVVAAEDTSLDGAAAASGTNVYNGDSIVTGAAGSVRLQFASSQVFVSPASNVGFSTGGANVTVLLRSGTAGFTSSQGGLVAIRALDVMVRSQTPTPTTAQVTVIAPDELKVASAVGTLELELDGQFYSLAPGRTYGVKIVSDTKLQNEGPLPRKNRGLIIIVFAATAGVAVLVYLIKELHESPAVP